MDVTTLNAMPPRTSADVLALAVRASTHDGVKPLSEQAVLDLRRLISEGAAATETDHLLVLDRPGEINAHVLGYAHVAHAGVDGASFELVVHPDHRRTGVGTQLLDRVLELWPDARGWAHGNLEAAQHLAHTHELQVVRELWQMSRPLDDSAAALPEVTVPPGFAVRTFEIGRDEEAWLAVNAEAFAAHAEQGRTSLADLQDRIEEPWFDPHGFLLIEDVREPQTPRLAGFHWTKVEPAAPGSSTSAPGEVYVVGVSPDYQGMGLGAVATLVGLRHLAACGLAQATLYVDADNEAAVATYRRLGFEVVNVDVMYAERTLP